MKRLLVVTLVTLAVTGACAERQRISTGAGPVVDRDATGKKAGEGRGPVEDPAPDFTVTTFDGGTFSLGEQRGTPVVLNFWESW